MTSGADLFVVCKQCGSEVSPYITECPYCGNRLRRRAPKLPRVAAPGRASRRQRPAFAAKLRRATGSRPRPARSTYAGGVSGTRPYATLALVALSCAAWIAIHAEPSIYDHLAILGPLHGDWWRIFTNEFVYLKGLYAFIVLVALAIFGWLIERRHGAVLVLGLFFGTGAVASLVACAVYRFPFVAGANGAALALIAAWATPDLRALRAGAYYEGDLLGAGAIAGLLLAAPFAFPSVTALVTGRGSEVALVVSGAESSWLVGVVGAAIGALVGLGVSSLGEREA
jgi:membrane associated rhomboid family serine protease